MFQEITRRAFGANTALVTAGLALSCGRSRDRPNIVWLIGEDISTDLGCYGNPAVQTPNLDRIAAEGIRFTRAYTTGAICSPSRSAIATGMYQTSLDAHHHRSHRDDGRRLPDGVRVFTYYLREAGYHTSNVLNAVPGVAGGKTDFNFTVEKPFDGTDWSQRRQGQPFYAQINFSETHRAFRRFAERPIDPGAVRLPPSFPDHPVVREDWRMYLETMQHLDVKVGKVIERLKQENLLDDTIVFFFGDNGRPFPRGKGWLFEGGIRVPLMALFPERFRPEGAKPGSVREDLVSMIDITATSLALAGIEPPPHMHGRPIFGASVKPRDHIVAAMDRYDETMDRVRCVRAQRFKYLRNFHPERPYRQSNVDLDTTNPTLRVMRELHAIGKLTPEQAHFMAARRPEEELYDLEADPHELKNLAASQEHEATLQEMRATLGGWIKQTGDQGEKPEQQSPQQDYRGYRVRHVDEWCTRDCFLSKANGVMRVEFSEKPNRHRVMRGIIAEGGAMELRFRARSRSAGAVTFTWGTVLAPADPANVVAVNLVTDGSWRQYAIPFQTEGTLTLLAFDIGRGEGAIEFDWISLLRNGRGEKQPVIEWTFA